MQYVTGVGLNIDSCLYAKNGQGIKYAPTVGNLNTRNWSLGAQSMRHYYIKQDRVIIKEKTLLRAYLEALQYTVLWVSKIKLQNQHPAGLRLLQLLEQWLEQQALTKVVLRLPQHLGQLKQVQVLQELRLLQLLVQKALQFQLMLHQQVLLLQSRLVTKYLWRWIFQRVLRAPLLLAQSLSTVGALVLGTQELGVIK